MWGLPEPGSAQACDTGVETHVGGGRRFRAAGGDADPDDKENADDDADARDDDENDARRVRHTG